MARGENAPKLYAVTKKAGVEISRVELPLNPTVANLQTLCPELWQRGRMDSGFDLVDEQGAGHVASVGQKIEPGMVFFNKADSEFTSLVIEGAAKNISYEGTGGQK